MLGVRMQTSVYCVCAHVCECVYSGVHACALVNIPVAAVSLAMEMKVRQVHLSCMLFSL